MENPKSSLHWLYCDSLGPIGSAAFLVARLAVGTAFMLHGWPKIHNPTGWMGAGAPTPGFMQALAAIAEFGGGLGLIFGFLSRIAPLGIFCVMLTALATVHIPEGHPFVSSNGPSYELVVAYMACMLMFLVLGPGRYSLDAMIFHRDEMLVMARPMPLSGH